MNGRKSKVLRRAAFILANKKSKLTWDGMGCRVYPKDSARAIYQRLKVEARDPARYEQLNIMVKLQAVSQAAKRAAGSLRQAAVRVDIALNQSSR
jgi:hypothetical protein